MGIALNLKKYKIPLLSVLLLVIGLLIFGGLIATKPQPSDETEPNPGRLVRVFEAQKTNHQVRITAYGTTRAGTEWKAIAEIKGRAVFVDPRFEPGELLPADLLLLKIDPTDYEISVKRYEAEVRSAQEQLRQIEREDKNLKEIQSLQDRQVELATAELERQRDLFKKGNVSRSKLDQAEADYTQWLVNAQQTRNSVELIPIRKDLQQAELELARANLEKAKADLARTEIRLPFAARCARREIETEQYAGIGAELGTFYSVDKAEAVVPLEPRQVRTLFQGGFGLTEGLDLSSATTFETLWAENHVPAEVRWGMGTSDVTWEGRLSRIEAGLDLSTRTVSFIVEVPKPYENVIPGIRPPLLPGVFCQVTIRGSVLNDVFVLPRESLRGHDVYLLRDNRLHIAPVQILALEDAAAIVRAEDSPETLRDGDKVILTDLFPATPGMILRGHLVDNPIQRLEPPIAEEVTADAHGEGEQP